MRVARGRAEHLGAADEIDAPDAPEVLVEEMIAAFRERYDTTIETVITAREDMYFPLPRELRAEAQR